MNNQKIGKIGEKIAQDYLKTKKYTIKDTHWQKRTGEIDIIAYDTLKKETVFVEVKTTTSLFFGFPEEKVKKDKIKKIIKTSFLYINEHPEIKKWRIDVISIYINTLTKKSKITHFKNIQAD